MTLTLGRGTTPVGRPRRGRCVRHNARPEKGDLYGDHSEAFRRVSQNDSKQCLWALPLNFLSCLGPCLRTWSFRTWSVRSLTAGRESRSKKFNLLEFHPQPRSHLFSPCYHHGTLCFRLCRYRRLLKTIL